PLIDPGAARDGETLDDAGGGGADLDGGGGAPEGRFAFIGEGELFDRDADERGRGGEQQVETDAGGVEFGGDLDAAGLEFGGTFDHLGEVGAGLGEGGTDLGVIGGAA